MDAGLLAVPLDPPTASWRLHFLPWTSSEGGAGLPVWYIDAPRGGDAWKLPEEAVEDVNAHYEELFLCTALQAEAQALTDTNENYPFVLSTHAKRLSATLRKEKRHGVNLRSVVRLLSDYDLSTLAPRASDTFESTIIERVNNSIRQDVRFKMSPQTFGIRRIDMTVNNYTGNIINYGIMADNTVSFTNNLLQNSNAPDPLKKQLEELRQPLLEVAKSLPEGEAKNLLKDYESLTETALREQPPKALVEAQGNQILATVKKVAQYAAPVSTIIAAIIGLLPG